MLEEIAIYCLQIIAFLGGLAFAYLAAFTYESEDGKLQDKLEKWWIELDDMRSRSANRLKNFVEKVSKTCSTWFDILFGDRLISQHAVSVSVCLSFGSILLILALFGFFIFPIKDPQTIAAKPIISRLLFSAFLCLGIVFFWKASKPARGKSPPLFTMYLIWTILGLSIIVPSIFSATVGKHMIPSDFIHITIGLLLGVFTDLFSIAISRIILRAKVKGHSPVKYFALLISTIILVFLLAAGLPLGLMIISITSFQSEIIPVFMWGAFALLSNLPSFISISIFFLASAILILARMLSPALSRIVYAAYRYKIIEKKRLLWSMSCGLLLASGIGPIRSLFESFSEILRG